MVYFYAAEHHRVNLDWHGMTVLRDGLVWDDCVSGLAGMGRLCPGTGRRGTTVSRDRLVWDDYVLAWASVG